MAAGLTYFSLLGVSEDVSQEELEACYQELAEYLASPSIPAQLHEWARRQASLVDEAYAVLADPERRAAARREQQPATDDARARSEALEAEAAPHQTGRLPERDATRPRRPRESVERRSEAGRPEPSRLGLFDHLLKLRSQPLLLGVLTGTMLVTMLLGAILLGRYGFPSGAGEATRAEEQVSAAVPLDTAHVAELVTALQQSPDDPQLLFELGETFFQANEWQSAIDWFTRLLAADPDNLHALTDVGTANYNLGRPAEAKAAWLMALELDPNDVQVHYNLGFLYANVEPRELASARLEWQTVVDLAPASDLARTAQVHLDSLLEEENREASPTPP